MKITIAKIARTALPLSAIALAIAPAGHAASNNDDSDVKPAAQLEWQRIREKVINANEIIGGDVTNGMNTFGDVSDLVLSKDAARVEYIMYEVPYPYSAYGPAEGFTRFNNAAFDSAGAFDVRVRISDQQAAHPIEDFTLTRTEADHRLVSNIVGQELAFSRTPGAFKEVQNLLIDRDSGAITHYVVEMHDKSLFNSEPRAIPAERVAIDSAGRLSTRINLDSLSDARKYQPDFL